ncbi:tyrosine-type recombinase/integrase [Herbaspirillum frisingense]|uniref:phage integrase n=1 Tax=Herbaspirillum frisingense TaxID=92645 RepID=UPI0039AF5108
MAIKKMASGWLVDIQPAGRGGKRFRKTFKTQAEAKVYETWLKNKLVESPEWQPPKKDLRKLSELVDIWFEHHGLGLRAGKNTYSRLKHLCASLGDPIAEKFAPEQFAAYRRIRLADGISQNNLNREHSYLRSVFNELRRLGYWKSENPLEKIRQFKVQERELTYLTHAQIQKLLKETRRGRNPDTDLITRICLSTGSRWSEAEEIRKNQIQPRLLQFALTKSGKTRAVPIDEALYKELMDRAEEADSERLFKYSYAAFREAIERAQIKLPEGQLTHVLRHTFASHFMMNGGNILILQRILGHSSLAMTMKYAHLAPDHLQEAVRLNPLSFTS